uniref:Uncharacterized protein n=1 Tax=Anguilla anguilla TaxID=7936 RepID=A0A0E9QID0_ANGAN
MSQFFFFFK